MSLLQKVWLSRFGQDEFVKHRFFAANSREFSRKSKEFVAEALHFPLNTVEPEFLSVLRVLGGENGFCSGVIRGGIMLRELVNPISAEFHSTLQAGCPH